LAGMALGPVGRGGAPEKHGVSEGYTFRANNQEGKVITLLNHSEGILLGEWLQPPPRRREAKNPVTKRVVGKKCKIGATH